MTNWQLVVTYADNVEHVDHNWLEYDSFILHIEIIIHRVAAHDHSCMIELFLVDGIILEHNNVLESTLRCFTILGIDIQCIRTTRVDWNLKFQTIGAGIWLNVATGCCCWFDRILMRNLKNQFKTVLHLD